MNKQIRKGEGSKTGENIKTTAPHNLILENRRGLTLSGVSDIDSFDENTVIAYTDLGELTIRGENLHINRFNIETGELGMEGEIQSLSYSSGKRGGGGFFGRLFK